MLRYVPQPRADEDPLRQAIIGLAAQYGRYGYRQITGLLQQQGWHISRSRVERIWKQEGLKVPHKQPKRGRLWLADGSCVRHRAARRTRSNDVINIFADVMIERGVPQFIRSDNGPEMIAKKLRSWLGKVGAQTLYITPGSPWENGYCENFDGKLRNELLNGEIHYALREAQVLIEQWRQHYNTVRPHSALGYRPPAPRAGSAGRTHSCAHQCRVSPRHLSRPLS